MSVSGPSGLASFAKTKEDACRAYSGENTALARAKNEFLLLSF